jgi:hypothetical protein
MSKRKVKDYDYDEEEIYYQDDGEYEEKPRNTKKIVIICLIVAFLAIALAILICMFNFDFNAWRLAHGESAYGGTKTAEEMQETEKNHMKEKYGDRLQDHYYIFEDNTADEFYDGDFYQFDASSSYVDIGMVKTSIEENLKKVFTYGRGYKDCFLKKEDFANEDENTQEFLNDYVTDFSDSDNSKEFGWYIKDSEIHIDTTSIEKHNSSEPIWEVQASIDTPVYGDEFILEYINDGHKFEKKEFESYLKDYLKNCDVVERPITLRVYFTKDGECKFVYTPETMLNIDLSFESFEYRAAELLGNSYKKAKVLSRKESEVKISAPKDLEGYVDEQTFLKLRGYNIGDDLANVVNLCKKYRIWIVDVGDDQYTFVSGMKFSNVNYNIYKIPFTTVVGIDESSEGIVLSEVGNSLFSCEKVIYSKADNLDDYEIE